MPRYGRSTTRHAHRSARLALSSARAVRVGVVADTHSAPHPDVAALLEREQVEAILHGGDIGDLGVLDALARVAPVTAVRGNIDSRTTSVPDSIELALDVAGDERLRVWLTHIAVNGPRLLADVARQAQAGGASMVVCGHSHVPFIGRDRGLTVFNPGSIGPRRFNLPITFGVMELTRDSVKLWHVSCETGERWMP